MLILCNNKGCMQTSEALYDEDSECVICQNCNCPINNISEPMKRALKSAGQIVRNSKKKAFTVGCAKCRKSVELVLDEDNNTLCAECFEEIKLTESFKLAMEESGLKLEKVDLKKQKAKKTTKKSK